MDALLCDLSSFQTQIENKFGVGQDIKRKQREVDRLEASVTELLDSLLRKCPMSSCTSSPGIFSHLEMQKFAKEIASFPNVSCDARPLFTGHLYSGHERLEEMEAKKRHLEGALEILRGQQRLVKDYSEHVQAAYSEVVFVVSSNATRVSRGIKKV
eukprot:GEMP01100656.1.p1 GENE.GEMP01100656.1~~GEMP01100656.1.p1  ORF type:complete len:156 (+),score=22.78 GEMP01100656.1:202-669(+)